MVEVWMMGSHSLFLDGSDILDVNQSGLGSEKVVYCKPHFPSFLQYNDTCGTQEGCAVYLVAYM